MIYASMTRLESFYGDHLTLSLGSPHPNCRYRWDRVTDSVDFKVWTCGQVFRWIYGWTLIGRRSMTDFLESSSVVPQSQQLDVLVLLS